MLALRQRVACTAQRAKSSGLRQVRRYASDSHGHGHGDGHHHGHHVEEPLGTGFFIAAGAVPASILVYWISRPGKDGEPSSLTNFLSSFDYLSKTWEERNTVRTAMFEQAAHDKHLFNYAGKTKHVELTYPEAFQTGSPYNVPAGHNINLDKVVEHYRQQHLAEEERKAAKLAAKKE